MRLFDRKSGSLLGVDIGSAAVKLVELSGSAQAPCVMACAIEPLRAAAANNISDAEAVGEAIRRAKRRAGGTARRAAAALPCSAAITKTVAFDAALTDREMEVEVAVEAERLMPFAGDELALDFEPLNLSAADPSLIDVLLVACRQDQVAAREAALQSAGLKAVLVDVETACLQRAVLGMSRNESDSGAAGVGAFAVLDAGSAGVLLLVLAEDEVLFSREESFAGGPFADGSRLAAEGESAYGEDVLRLAERLLRQFASASAGHRLERLVLTGGGASTPRLATLASTQLGLPVDVAAPFAGMTFAQDVDTAWAQRHAPSLATACGLALRAFDAESGATRCCA